VPFGPFAARMFAPASCLRSPAVAGMTAIKDSRRSAALGAQCSQHRRRLRLAPKQARHARQSF
jgi:hypothetical protein